MRTVSPLRSRSTHEVVGELDDPLFVGPADDERRGGRRRAPL